MSPELRLTTLSLAALLIALPTAAIAQTYIPPETILRDDITYTVHFDGSYVFEENLAVRLNTEEAVEDDGESYIDYSGSDDHVKLIDAYTMTTDGKRLDVPPAKIMDQQSGDDDDDSFSDQQEKAIIFSGLSPGAVKNYHYIIDTNTPDFPGQFDTTENFPVDSATQSASVTVIAPAGLALYFEADGMAGGAAANPQPYLRKWVYTLRDVPGQAPEDNSVDTDDFSPRLEISSFPNFAAVGAAYEQRAADKAKITPKVQQLADRITHGITTPRGRAVALYDWVSRNIRYVSVDIGDSGYVPDADDDIIDAGYGDCKDHVTLLKALLAAKNIPSSGVLVNWDDGYQPSRIAMPAFNHIITYIPQWGLFADSTAQFAPFGVLPTLERGKQALITGAPGIPSRAIVLPLASSGVPDATRVVTHEVLAPEGTVTGNAAITGSGRYELGDREDFDRIASGTGAQAAAAQMARFNVQGSGDFTAGDPHDLTKPFGYTTSFSMPGYAALPGPGTMPIPAGVPPFGALENMLKYAALPVRTVPVSCPAADIEETSFLSVPAALRIKSLPVSINFQNAIGTYQAAYTQQGNSIKIDRHLITHPTGPTCNPAQYQLLRALSFAIGRDFRATIGY